MPLVKLSALDVFAGRCIPCDQVWIVGAFLDPMHAVVARKLNWLCPDCKRPLDLKTAPYQGLPDVPPC